MGNGLTPIEIKAPPHAIVFPVVSLASFVSVFYTPALPAIASYFDLSPDYTESSMYFYLLFVAIGCLIFGPISNKLGRKPALYIGIGIAILGSLLCIGSGTIDESFILFDIGRMLQALGGAAGLQVGFTIIGDCYKPPKSIRVTSYISLAFAIGPSIGMSISRVLNYYFGWVGCFYFILVYLISIMILVIYFVPETLLIKHRFLTAKKILHNYWAKIGRPRIFLTGLIVGCVVAFTCLYYSIAPFIGTNFLKLSPEIYGFYGVIPPIFLVSGCLLTSLLVKFLKPVKIIVIGFFIIILISIVFFVIFLSGIVNINILVFSYSASLIGQSFVQINLIGMVMHHSLNKSLTSSLVMFINISISALAEFLLNIHKTQNLMLLPIAFLILGIVALGLYICLYKVCKKTSY